MKKVLTVILLISVILVGGCTKSAENQVNNVYFDGSVTALNYKGSFLFDDIVEKDVQLLFNKVASLKYGQIYEFRLNPIEGVPDERLVLGYFVIQQDKIYKINLDGKSLDELKASKELPSDSILVCQNEELKDPLKESEKGWHQYIVADGDMREYHSYNSQVSTGYYETFIWEKNKGLISYRSGFGAENESIELQLINQ